MNAEFKPTYPARLSTVITQKVALSSAMTLATVLAALGVACPGIPKPVQLLCSVITLPVLGVSVFIRKEMLKAEWELDMHQRLSEAEHQRMVMNSYAPTVDSVGVPPGYPGTVN